LLHEQRLAAEPGVVQRAHLVLEAVQRLAVERIDDVDDAEFPFRVSVRVRVRVRVRVAEDPIHFLPRRGR